VAEIGLAAPTLVLAAALDHDPAQFAVPCAGNSSPRIHRLGVRPLPTDHQLLKLLSRKIQRQRDCSTADVCSTHKAGCRGEEPQSPPPAPLHVVQLLDGTCRLASLQTLYTRMLPMPARDSAELPLLSTREHLCAFCDNLIVQGRREKVN